MRVIIIGEEKYAAKGLERMPVELRPDIEVIKKYRESRKG